jgi:hypothetical protein
VASFVVYRCVVPRLQPVLHAVTYTCGNWSKTWSVPYFLRESSLQIAERRIEFGWLQVIYT